MLNLGNREETAESWGQNHETLDTRVFIILPSSFCHPAARSNGANGIPSVVFGAWGKGKAFLNFESKRWESKPRIQLDGQVFLGA